MHIAIIGPANPMDFVGDLDVNDRFPIGMGGAPVNGLVRSLLDRGHSVTLITGEPGGQSTWKAKGDHLTVISVPFRERARARILDQFKRERIALGRELKNCKADVYHAHWTYEFALACQEAEVHPLLITAHDAPFTILRNMPDIYRLIRVVMAIRVRLSTRNLTAVSPYLASRWRAEMRYFRPISVISNPIPPLVPATRVHSQNPIILDIADASKRKNLKTLLQAFALIQKTYPASELRLAGQGLEPSGKLSEWAKNRGLRNNVSFLGILDREQIARELALATVFCHASKEESQGMGLLEAMISGVPIVAGEKAGAVPWTLFDGRAGDLTDVTTPKAFANSVVDVLGDLVRSTRKAELAEQLVWTRFDPVAIVEEYIVEYHRLIDQHSKTKKGREGNHPKRGRLPHMP